MLYRTINPKISILISVLSGAGFVAILAFTPVKLKKSGRSYFQSLNNTKSLHGPSDELVSISENIISSNQNSSQSENDSAKSNDANSKKNDFLKLNPSLNQDLDKSNNEFSITHSVSPNSLSLNQMLYTAPVQGETFLNYKDNRLTVHSIMAPKIPFTNIDKGFTPVSRNQPLLRNMEIDYSISSSVSAVMRTISSDYGDRFKERTTAFAGINLQGNEFFSTQIVAGNTYTSNVNNYIFQSHIPVSTLTNRFIDRDLYGSGSRDKLLELQTNFVPSQHLQIQAALFNSRKDNSINFSSPDGGRLSVLLNIKNIAFNLRYNYLNTTDPQKNQFNYNFTNLHGADSAAVGLTIFLDNNKNYSFYVGGNYSNIMNRSGGSEISQQNLLNPFLFPSSFNLNLGGISQMNSPSMSSFSASFR
ncbi:MAG: hypothetical protein HUU45_00185 [Leptospiraceae bacterium]|nr:hypothetical protein [Leptospiraceae bacterium]